MIDCFMFFNELDLLEIRLNSLAPYVERFVLCECPVTHTGKPKPLFFEENKARFKDFNITHLIVNDYEKYLTLNAWDMENHQRDFLINGILDVPDRTTVLLSDLDEIPDLTNYKEGTEGIFRQKMYYYALNIFTGKEAWHGTIAVLRKNIVSMNDVRQNRKRMSFVPGFGGWHFAYALPLDQIIYKIESFGHQEFNTPGVKRQLAERIKNLDDIYGRRRHRGPYKIEMPSGPEWLLKNKGRYEHLFYKENQCTS